MLIVGLLAGCVETVLLPRLEVSDTSIELAGVALGETAVGSVTVTNVGEVVLSGVSVTATGGVVAPSGDAGPLCAGCSLDVAVSMIPDEPGNLLAALTIQSAAGGWATDGRLEALPEAQGDPLNFVQEVAVVLTGPVAPSVQFVFIRRIVEVPWHWPDGTSTETTWTGFNAGNQPVSVLTPVLDQCGPDVEVIDAPTPGLKVQPLETVEVTVRHTPADPASLRCTVTLPTDEGVSAIGELWFTAPSFSAPPEVTITSPVSGAALRSGEEVELTFSLSDDLDTPTTMAFAVYSLVRGEYVLYGRPGNDSGTVTGTLSASALAPGPDTLTVAAQDWHGNLGFDSISVRIDDPAADDADGDGWGVADGDCDDARADVFPDGKEVTDGADQDCDGAIDDGTPETDDDGDGFAEDDCDDRDATASPGELESADGADNDCDGSVDEETTNGDDDRDGYAEALGDCDDADSGTSPEAWEFCDGDDDNCDGEIDDGCPENEPVIAAISVVPDACHSGQVVTVSVIADEGLSLVWSSDAGSDTTRFADWLAGSTTFTCPELADPDASQGVTIAVIGSDDQGRQAFATARVVVVPADWSLEPEVEVPGCAGEAAAGAFGWVPAVFLWRRRRQA